jgi:hypothetical protein
MRPRLCVPSAKKVRDPAAYDAASPDAVYRLKGDGGGCRMTNDRHRIETVTDDELRLVRGGKSFWSRVKGAAKWVKNHVVGGAKWIGLKFRF